MASKDIQRKREEELDNLLRVEGGRMKRELQERSRRHNMELLRTLNHQASKLIKQKDDQLQQANQKNMELQANVNTVQTEVDAWKNRTMAGRAIVHNLQNEVEKATKKREKKGGEGSSSKKMESSVGSNDHVVDPARACKVCTIRETCMILMPCRHMCCCRPCAHAVKLCPICGAANRQGLHVAMD